MDPKYIAIKRKKLHLIKQAEAHVIITLFLGFLLKAK